MYAVQNELKKQNKFLEMAMNIEHNESVTVLIVCMLVIALNGIYIRVKRLVK